LARCCWKLSRSFGGITDGLVVADEAILRTRVGSITVAGAVFFSAD
jgi:hypothetical protein